MDEWMDESWMYERMNELIDWFKQWLSECYFLQYSCWYILSVLWHVSLDLNVPGGGGHFQREGALHPREINNTNTERELYQQKFKFNVPTNS